VSVLDAQQVMTMSPVLVQLASHNLKIYVNQKPVKQQVLAFCDQI
jgi:hypothetical protein